MKKYKYKLLIKNVRLVKHVKQNELAKKLGITKGYLSKLENKKEVLTLDMLIKIGSELDTCPKNLFTVKKILK